MRKDLKLPTQRPGASDTNAYEAWASTKSPEAWDALYAQLKPTIDTAIKNFGGNDPSLRVRAMILAKQAMEDYDPNNLSGATPPTHVYNRLKRLNRYREERQSPVYYPESVRDDRRALYRYQQAFREKHQRDPSRQEIMDDLGLSRRRVIKALGLAQDVPSSLMESDKGQQMAAETDPNARRRMMRTDYVYQDQDQIGKKIMEWTMGYGGVDRLPKSEIATRLNITAPAVSKRINKILEKIEAPEEYDQSATDMRPVGDAPESGVELSDDLLPKY